MTTTTRLAGCAAILAGLVATVTAADAGKGVLPPKQLEALLKQDAALIAAAAKDTKLNKKAAAKKAQAAAIMVAAYAQDAIASKAGDPAKLAGLRDEALKLAEALAGGDVAAATGAKLAVASAPSGDPAPKKLVTPEQVDVVMKMFSASEKTGGLAMEKELKGLIRKPMAKGDLGKVAGFAYKLAVIGQVSEHLAPPAEGKKKPEDWVKWSKDMTEAAAEAAAAAEKGDVDAVKSGLRKADTSCVNCHNVFRTE